MQAISKKGTIDSQGFKLGYIIEGEGMPALVIGSSVYYPRTFLGNIREHLKLIFIDHRGFVPPPRELAPEDYQLNVLLADVDRIRKELELENVLVIGHSGHAFLALEYAKKYTQHVSRVVMIGVSPNYSAATHQATAAFFQTRATPERKQAFDKNMALLPAQIEAAPERRFVAFCVAAGPQSWYDYQFDATALWRGVYTNMQIIDHVWGAIFRDIDITEGLADFDKPVLLLLGKYDFLTGPPTLWDSVRGRFNDLTISVFEESSHTPQYEEPDLFNQTLLRWLGVPTH
ncbi:alpha/beta fold hydrolase [Tellurirhabdus bombi]|uniref:alpha/beta fold hydrolase n=1 Tax=Tellurirhabdus bombi TaxID=2907205 RepID=UPI001F2D2F3B|nr:alpha/beta hydrolase [Tellurirhabdus bombi]